MKMRTLSLSFLCFACPLQAASALTLEEAERASIGANPAISEEQAGVKAAQSAVLRAALPDPAVSFESSTGGEAREAAVFQTFPLNGSLSSERKAAAADLEAARLRLKLAEKVAASETRKIFHAAVIAGERTRFEEKNFVFAMEFLNKVEERVLSGKLSNVDLIRAKIELDRSRLRREQAEAELKKLRSSLNRLLGRPTDGPLQLEADSAAFFIAGPDTAPVSLEDRLDLRILELRARAAGFGVAAEKRRRTLPDLTLGAAAVKDFGERYARFSAGLSLPLWSGSKGAVLEAQSRSDRLAAEERAARLDAAHELNIAEVTLNVARERALLLSRNLDAVHELRRLASLDYLSGRTQLTEYYEANRVFVDGNLEYLDSMKEYQWAKADFEKALSAPLAAGEENENHL